MRHFEKLKILQMIFFLGSISITHGQEYEILIKNGHLIDPKNNIDQKMDVAVTAGKIVDVSQSIPETSARTIINAENLYITPGLIDIHGHIFWGTKPDAYISNSYTSLPPDGFTFRVGVTTIVDAGSAGWRNFRLFKEQTIDHSKTRVLAFLNIVGSGMKGGAIEQNLADMDPKLSAMVAGKYADFIVGIKLAHYSGPEWEPVKHMVNAGELADIPTMIDFGGNTPQLSLERLLLEEMRPGDIYTHCFANVRGRTAIVDENGKVRPYVWEAQERGIVFDVGHGGGSFVFEQAIPAMEEGFKPNSISTDLHTGSMNGGMKDMLNVMSKFLNMGMSLIEVVRSSTWNPAMYIKRENLGHLSVGADADIAILRLKEGNFGFTDVKGMKIPGTQKLECELTIRDGDVVYDLNGISMPEWKPGATK
jgi:dihydroorotase